MSSISPPVLEVKTLSVFNKAMVIPLLLIISAIGVHFFYHYYVLSTFHFEYQKLLTSIEQTLYAGLFAGGVFWLINGVINQLKYSFRATQYASHYHTLNILINSLIKIIKGIVFIIILNFFLQNLHLTKQFSILFDKASSIFIISATGWIIFQIINSVEQLLLHHLT